MSENNFSFKQRLKSFAFAFNGLVVLLKEEQYSHSSVKNINQF
jgi:hypothetical protein